MNLPERHRDNSIINERSISMLKPIVLATALALVPAIANAECGDRGGPGYRGPDGRCQSWRDVGRNCGSGACTPEQVNPNAPAAIQRGLDIKRYQDEGHRGAVR